MFVTQLWHCIAIMGLSVVMWTFFGYSYAFGEIMPGIIGDFRWFGLNNVGMSADPYADSIPHLVFCGISDDVCYDYPWL